MVTVSLCVDGLLSVVEPGIIVIGVVNPDEEVVSKVEVENADSLVFFKCLVVNDVERPNPVVATVEEMSTVVCDIPEVDNLLVVGLVSSVV